MKETKNVVKYVVARFKIGYHRAFIDQLIKARAKATLNGDVELSKRLEHLESKHLVASIKLFDYCLAQFNN